MQRLEHEVEHVLVRLAHEVDERSVHARQVWLCVRRRSTRQQLRDRAARAHPHRHLVAAGQAADRRRQQLRRLLLHAHRSTCPCMRVPSCMTVAPLPHGFWPAETTLELHPSKACSSAHGEVKLHGAPRMVSMAASDQHLDQGTAPYGHERLVSHPRTIRLVIDFSL